MPRLLDLFSGAGGAAMGYSRAGFDVVGVDINPQPHYPFAFVQADALEQLRMFAQPQTWRPLGFDVIHASPPCQLFSRAGKLREAQGGTASTVNLIPQTRALLEATGLPYVIENVPGAPLEGVTVCGSFFGLKVRRHRLFESNVPLLGTGCEHKAQGRPIGVYHVMGDDIPQGGSTARNLEEAQAAMGIDWMPWASLKEAIPPSYTEWIGRQLLAAIKSAA